MQSCSWIPVPVFLCLACVTGYAAERDGLLLEYRFDGDLRDTSGNGRDGTFVAGEPRYAPGRDGQALVLDGTAFVDSGLVLPQLDAFTVECWANPGPEQVEWADILGNHAGGGTSGLVIQQRGKETNAFTFVYGSASGGYVESVPTPLAPNRWHHLVLVKDTGEMRGYVNGLLTVAMPATGPMAASDIALRIGLGFPQPSRCFRGMIDSVRVWNRALENPTSDASDGEQLDAFAACGMLRGGLRMIPADPPGTVEVSTDPRFLPRAVDSIHVSLRLQPADGSPSAQPPAVAVDLERAGGFAAKLPMLARPGYYRVAADLRARAGERVIDAAPAELAFVIPRPPAAEDDAAPSPATALSLDGDDWLIAMDPENKGTTAGWASAPPPAAQAARVPGIIQETFPGYHGLAWYWRRFPAPTIPFDAGRAVLRFAQADYKAEAWLNGTPVGGHEGGETPFDLDVTSAIRPGEGNLLAVRILNPTHERIDGIVLNETPRRCKVMPYHAGAAYNHGGITAPVELALTPPVTLRDVWVRPDADTGTVRVRITARNTLDAPVRARIECTIAAEQAPARPEALPVRTEAEVPPGDGEIELRLHVREPKLWDLATPVLYRVTARLDTDHTSDRRSVRCGFRDFRFENGFFRLNGRRIFLRSAHTVNHFPVGQQFPHDPDFARRDLLTAKTMGFNMVRFICGGATPEQLDLCDEIGLMVYEESYASWLPMEDSPHLGTRFDRSIGELITRDRNHPAVVVWGLLNEAPDGPLFRHAVGALPLVRYLDDSRLVMLNSGRWDRQQDIGSLANPDSAEWEPSLGTEGMQTAAAKVAPPTAAGGYMRGAGDAHIYVRVPQTAEATDFLRTVGDGTNPVFLSEYGIGSAADLWRTVRHFERLGKTDLEDARFYRDKLEQFLADWDRWNLDECFDMPEAFFEQSLARMASQRTLGLNAVRSNPNLVGHNLTGLIDHVMSGEGLTTPFREMKPGTIDALFDAWAPLRFCLFAEPPVAYSDATVKLEAVLANEDALPPGTYPVRVLLVAPDGTRTLDRTVDLTIPPRGDGPEPPFAMPVFAAEVPVDGPPGRWQFKASFQQGAAAAGGTVSFHTADRRDMPAVGAEVLLFGNDPELQARLDGLGIRCTPWQPGPVPAGAVVLAGAAPPENRGEAFAALALGVENGATVVFLCPSIFAGPGGPDEAMQPFAKGRQVPLNSWLYLMDVWGKDHPMFDGLPTGGLLDYVFYRGIIRETGFVFETPPKEAVAGAVNAAVNYGSGLMLSIHDRGKGRVIISSLAIRENLGAHPAAERLLRNMLHYAAKP